MVATRLVRPRAVALAALVSAATLVLASCSDAGTDGAGGSDSASSATASSDSEPDTSDADHPAVLAAELSPADDGTWDLDVTLSSEYDTPERYADGWRVLSADGEVLGEQELGHDHADEQPFTRSQSGLEIPSSATTVTIEGSDTDNGYGGQTLEIDVPAG